MVGNLQYHNSNEDFIFENKMTWWKEESDKISIGETYEYFDNDSEVKRGIIIERVNFYSFGVISENRERVIPIERFLVSYGDDFNFLRYE